MTDPQMAGLIDLLLLQQKEILDLKASVFALAGVAHDLGGVEAGERYLQLRGKFRIEVTIRGAGELIQALEGISLQLKQSGGTIQ